MKNLGLVIIFLAMIVGILGISQTADAAIINQISSPVSNGFYNEGDSITIELSFSEPVYTNSTTTLYLTSGSLARCNFSIGLAQATSTASCVYTVSDGDSTSLLNIKDISNNIYDLSDTLLTSLVPTINLGTSKNIIIDTITPKIRLVSSTVSDNYYDVGDTIPIDITFSEPIYGDITLGFNASSTASCTFSVSSSTPSGSGSCDYIISSGDSTSALDVSSLSGAFDRAGNSLYFVPLVSQALANINLSSNQTISIDTAGPRVSTITTQNPDGIYDVGDSITVDVLFSEAVYSSGDFTLNFNASSTASCAFSIASATSSVSCVYTFQSGDFASRLNVDSVSGNVFNSGNFPMVNFKIRDQNLTVGSNIIIDDILPYIDTITMPAVLDGIYNSGVKQLVIDFSEPITTTGTSTIYLDASANASCSFAQISSLSSQTTCDYTIANGDNSSRLSVSSVVSNIYDIGLNQPSSLTLDDVYLGDRYIIVDTTAPVALISGEPSSVTTDTVANITVSGNDVQYYKYSLDSASWTGSTPTSTVLALTGLVIGNHTLSIIGADTVGNWQSSVSSTDHAWEVISLVPSGGGGGGGGGGAINRSPKAQVLGVKIYSYSSGRMVKVKDDSAIYHITNDGQRHLYPNEVTFWTWHTGTWSDQTIETISQLEFDLMFQGDNITVRPDSKLIRFFNSPRTYVVSDSAIINYVNSDVALELYGIDWEYEVIMIQNGFESNYTRGEAIIL